jgi:hypothetical protein
MMRHHIISVLLGIYILGSPYAALSAEKPAAQGVVLQIIDALITDGKIQRDCVNQQPQRDKVVEVTLIKLTNGNYYQYLVKGNAPCAFGARDPLWYVYAEDGGKYTLIADIGATGSVEISKITTNGWKDIICHYTYNAGSLQAVNVFKFDGKIYNYSRTIEKGKIPVK